MRQMCQVKLSPDSMRQFNPAHLSPSGDAMDTPAAARVIREAFEMGYTFFDTAECYVGENAAGETLYNEDAVGEALRPVRDQVVIATKFGVYHNPDKTLSVDSRPETIRRAIDGSLSRLGIDCIDLYYQHRTDPNVEPEEVAGVMAELMGRQDPRMGHLGGGRGLLAASGCGMPRGCRPEPLLHARALARVALPRARGAQCGARGVQPHGERLFDRRV